MSNVIRFLETIGGKPALSAVEYAATVAMLDAEMPQKRALLQRDPAALNDLLVGPKKLLCAIFAADED